MIHRWRRLGRYSATSASAASSAPSSPSCCATKTPTTCRHNSGTLTPRVEYIYRGDEWARIFNEPGLDKVPAYGVVNLNVEYAPRGSKLRLSLAATNVTDEAGINSRYTDPFGTGQTSDQYIPPRQIIGSIAYSF